MLEALLMGRARKELRDCRLAGTTVNAALVTLTRFYEPVKDREELAEELASYKQKTGQSVRYYYSEIKAKARKAFPASDGVTAELLERQVRTHFLRGLLPALKNAVKMGSCKTMPDTLEYAIQIEQVLGRAAEEEESSGRRRARGFNNIEAEEVEDEHE